MFILLKSNGLLTMKGANLGICLSESDINWSLVLFMAPSVLEHIKIVSHVLLLTSATNPTGQEYGTFSPFKHK
jgi:hypothetical protein